MWLVGVAVFMQTLDTTIVNTALPSMAVSLGESPLRMQAVVISYALTLAMLIPASGWLADRAGTRRVFVAAVVVFTAGSLACAMSRQLSWLVAARVLRGSFVCVGLVTLASAAIFAQLEPTNRIPESTVKEASAGWRSEALPKNARRRTYLKVGRREPSAETGAAPAGSPSGHQSVRRVRRVRGT